ncbi:MAG: RDD family protein [Candidatus Acidiferrales bacterium]
MYCSKCGWSIPDGVAFCSACGQPVPGGPAGQPQAAPINPPPAVATPPTPAPVQPAWQAPAARAPVAYAGFWLRFVAFIIDAIILVFVAQLLTLPFAASMGFGMRGMFNGHPPNPADFIPMFGIFMRIFAIRLILNWLYYALLESSSWQATLGKKALGLEVTDLEGNRISFGRASGRFFAKIISGLILLIGYIMAGFTEKKQALHDMIAGTLVIRKL